jgi:hypothetical protein
VRGDLTHTSLTALLPDLAASGTTGLLTVRAPGDGEVHLGVRVAEVRLWLRDGEVVVGEARDDTGTARPALLHRLRTAGLPSTRDTAGARADSVPVEHLAIPPRLLAPHVTELLVEAFRTAAAWTEGDWELDAMTAVPRLPSLPVATLLSRAADRAAEFTDDLADTVAAVPVLEPVAAYAGLDLAPEAWAVLSLADGVRTTGEVAAACGLTVPEAVHVVAALTGEGILHTRHSPLGPPVVLPAPRRAEAPAPVDDLRVITLPPDTEAPVPPVPRPGQAAFVQCPAAPGPDPDTAAFLRELSALTGEIERVVPDAAVSAAAAAETAVPAVVETAAKTPKRRLFGR